MADLPLYTPAYAVQKNIEQRGRINVALLEPSGDLKPNLVTNNLDNVIIRERGVDIKITGDFMVVIDLNLCRCNMGIIFFEKWMMHGCKHELTLTSLIMTWCAHQIDDNLILL